MSDGQAESVINVLVEKRERLNERANRHRDLRDRLNDQTREHAQRRDELNAKVRGIVDRANKHKAERDELNRKVRAAKDERDVLNRAANEKAEALNQIKRERSPGASDGQSVGRIKHELRKLEYEQQTKVLKPKKEKELIDKMAHLLKELKDKESALESDDTIRVAYTEMKAAKEAAENQHRAVTELANAAQEQHDSMVQLFNEADTYRKEADQAQAEFVKAKMEADKVHHEYIEMVNEIRDIERVGQSMTAGAARRARAETGREAKAEAEEIFDKFRKGEKLSTEDLMSLQKAGRL